MDSYDIESGEQHPSQSIPNAAYPESNYRPGTGTSSSAVTPQQYHSHGQTPPVPSVFGRTSHLTPSLPTGLSNTQQSSPQAQWHPQREDLADPPPPYDGQSLPLAATPYSPLGNSHMPSPFRAPPSPILPLDGDSTSGAVPLATLPPLPIIASTEAPNPASSHETTGQQGHVGVNSSPRFSLGLSPAGGTNANGFVTVSSRTTSVSSPTGKLSEGQGAREVERRRKRRMQIRIILGVVALACLVAIIVGIAQGVSKRNKH